MKEIYNFLEYKKAKLHYKKVGFGKKILFSFHGFGQSLHHLEKLEKTFGDKYTIYFFDIFYHGHSTWQNASVGLDKNFWKEVIDCLLEQESIHQFSLFGFSIGGVYALMTLETMPQKVEKVYLLASEGLQINLWYKFLMQNGLSRWIFKQGITNPFFVEMAANLLARFKWIHPAVVKFVIKQIDTPEKQQRLYQTWTLLRNIHFNLHHLASLIQANQIQLYIFAGDEDVVVPPQHIYPLIQELKPTLWAVLNAPHHRMIEAWAVYWEEKQTPSPKT